MDLTTILFILSLPFVLLTVYFGTKNDFYESENYKGDGCAHDVKRWLDLLLSLNKRSFIIKLQKCFFVLGYFHLTIYKFPKFNWIWMWDLICHISIATAKSLTINSSY